MSNKHATFTPHPALVLPNVLPFLASKHHQEEALMSAMMQQRLINSYAAMTSMMTPQVPNPFFIPYMNRPVPPPPPPMRPMLTSIPKQRMVPTLAPPSMLMKPKSSQAPTFNNAKPSPAEKLETVNGGFGIKNPLAKNPAIQDHLIQTMGGCFI